mgnify:CR=1 FL=1
MIDAPLALAFTAGMVATVNPCGFALLPAYVSAFVAGDEVSRPGDRRIVRAVGVSAAVSVGFAAVFVSIGSLFNATSSALRDRMPWVTILIGVSMIVIGIAGLVGRRIRLPLRSPQGPVNGDALGMIGFGMSYAFVSLSCTLGTFLAVTGFALDRSLVGGLITFVAYAAGMGTVILALSVSSALAQGAIARWTREFSRVATQIAGGLLVLSGAYAVWYGVHEIRVYGGDVRTDRVINAGTRLQTGFYDFVLSIGAVRLGMIVLAATLSAYAGIRIRSRGAAPG